MKLFTYQAAKRDKKVFKTLTGLSIKEFDELSIAFEETWKEYTKQAEKNPQQGGRPYSLKTIEDRLFLSCSTSKPIPYKPSWPILSR